MLRLNFLGLCMLAGLAVAGWAQLPPPAREIQLYSGVAPGSEKWTYPERVARHAGQTAGAEYRSTRTPLLPGGKS